MSSYFLPELHPLFFLKAVRWLRKVTTAWSAEPRRALVLHGSGGGEEMLVVSF